MEIAKHACYELGYKCKAGKIATSEKFIADNREKSYIAEKYCSDFIDMECGCAAEIAYIFKIPVVFVKGISNYADSDADYNFKAYVNQSNFCSNEVALVMLREIQCDCTEDKYNTCDIDPKHFKELTVTEIENVLSVAKHVNLGVSENNIPYVVPMCFEYDAECHKQIKLLSLPYGKKMTCMKNNDKVALEFMVQTPLGFKSVVAFGRVKFEPTYKEFCGDHLTEIIVEIREITGREYKRCI